jgi:hypothetical protein
MFRTSAATLILMLLTSVAPVTAADRVGTTDDSATQTPIVAFLTVPPSNVNGLLPPLYAQREPSRGAVLPALYVSLAGLNAFDAYSTSRGVSSGAAEANPTIRPFAGNRAALWAVKGGVTAATITIADRLWRKNRRVQAVAVMVVSNGLAAAVAARNVSVIRRQQ